MKMSNNKISSQIEINNPAAAVSITEQMINEWIQDKPDCVLYKNVAISVKNESDETEIKVINFIIVSGSQMIVVAELAAPKMHHRVRNLWVNDDGGIYYGTYLDAKEVISGETTAFEMGKAHDLLKNISYASPPFIVCTAFHLITEKSFHRTKPWYTQDWRIAETARFIELLDKYYEQIKKDKQSDGEINSSSIRDRFLAEANTDKALTFLKMNSQAVIVENSAALKSEPEPNSVKLTIEQKKSLFANAPGWRWPGQRFGR